MTKEAILIIVAGVLLCAGGALAFTRAAQDRAERSREDPARGDLTKVNRRSQQSEIYFQGVPLAQARSLGWTNIDEREAAAARFPTVESCLTHDPEKAKSLSIDWNKIGSDIESEVCLSRVANRLRTLKKMVAWLRSHGFDVINVRAADGSNAAPEAEERAGNVIEASWSIERNGPLSRRGLVAPLAQRLLAHNTSVIIFISEPSGHVSVNVVTNRL